MDTEQLLASRPPRSMAQVVLPPALARAMDVYSMPRWKRITLRVNWSGASNWLFLLSMIFYVINSCYWLNEVHQLPYFPHLSGRHLGAVSGLIGATGFMIEPIMDIVGCWVEAWDDVLWTAHQAAEKLPRSQHNATGTPASSYTSHSAVQLMVRNVYFWAAVLFLAGSAFYMWFALVPFLYGDYCDTCAFVWERLWFACVDEEHGWPDVRRQLQAGNFSDLPHIPKPRWPKDTDKDHGFCAVEWFGTLIFVIDALLALGGWWASRAETNELLGCERTMWPCRCRRRWPTTDWLGWGSWGFLVGAILELANGFVTNSYWDNILSLAAQGLWCFDAVLFLLDQAIMDTMSDVRKLPVVQVAVEGTVEVRWEEDRDALGHARPRRSSRMVQHNRGGRRRSSVFHVPAARNRGVRATLQRVFSGQLLSDADAQTIQAS